MKTYTITKLIELHRKQAYILELMIGERGKMRELLAKMYSENSARILHLLNMTNDKATTDFINS